MTNAKKLSEEATDEVLRVSNNNPIIEIAGKVMQAVAAAGASPRTGRQRFEQAIDQAGSDEELVTGLRDTFIDEIRDLIDPDSDFLVFDLPTKLGALEQWTKDYPVLAGTIDSRMKERMESALSRYSEEHPLNIKLAAHVTRSLSGRQGARSEYVAALT
jgi:hypothetical protein